MSSPNSDLRPSPELDESWHTPKRRKTMPAPSRVVDVSQTSEGDLVLVVGKGKKVMLLRVHSAILKMASPVFRAMLGANFIEGSTTHTADNPLDLKEDDAQAMLDLCSLIQHQYKSSDSLPVTRMANLVVVADKYQWVEIVRVWVAAAIAPYFPPSIEEKSRKLNNLTLRPVNAMCMAYAIGHAELFWRTSRTVIVQRNAVMTKNVVEGGLYDLMPDGFFGESVKHFWNQANPA